ncbi:MAG: alpha/beta hydrolase [Carboxylicivirga sp.]|nr:alpha/beta hydrolase [Carboxylicivirga sp.]
MTKTLLLLFFTLCITANCQTIFKYEREINSKQNYHFQEINFKNTNEKIILSGTLITPKNNFEKVIVIVPGSGKDTRYTHPRLTEKLLEHNIAVYRFDERGIGQSQGKYTYCVSPLISDLNHCILNLRSNEITKGKTIGVLGHSLGGMATIGISESNPKVDFYIQMATPVNAGESFKHRLPKEKMFTEHGLTFEQSQAIIDTFNYVIRTSKNLKAIKKRCARISKKLDCPELFRMTYTKPQFADMIKLDTESFYKNINKPLLYIIGSDDEAVHVKYDVQKLNEFDNRLISISVLDGMDHCLTYNNGEWSKETESKAREVDDVATQTIIEWILKI